MTKRWTLLTRLTRLTAAWVVVLLAAVGSVPAQPPAMRGYALPLYSADPRAPYEKFLNEIHGAGATHVALLFPWFMTGAEGDAPAADPARTASNALLTRLVRHARALPLDVYLVPILLLPEESGEDWRGSLRPPEVAAWFAAYGGLMGELATLAEAEGVAMLSIGSELTSLEQHAGEWRRLAASLRDVYKGKLVYTANWDVPENVGWWDAVDHLGVSAYYELADDDGGTTETLTAEWLAWKAWLLDHRDRKAPGKKVILTEVGYPSIAGGAAFPWDYTRDKPVSFMEQHAAIESFIRAWDGDANLEGAFIYAWFDFAADPARSYAVRDKPAEELVRGWFDAKP